MTLRTFGRGAEGACCASALYRPLSKQSNRLLADQLALYVAEQAGDSLTPNLSLQESAKQVFSVDYYGKFMLYVLIVALSVCNVVMLYVFFWRRSRRRLQTYTGTWATSGAYSRPRRWSCCCIRCSPLRPAGC